MIGLSEGPSLPRFLMSVPFACVHTRVCACTSAYTDVHGYVCACTRVCTRVHTCICVCAYTCVCACARVRARVFRSPFLWGALRGVTPLPVMRAGSQPAEPRGASWGASVPLLSQTSSPPLATCHNSVFLARPRSDKAYGV